MSDEVSGRFELRKEDLRSWFRVALLFLLPVLAIYLTFLLGNIEADGFQYSDFIPSMFVQGAMVAYVINEILALIKKWVEDNKS